MDLNFLRVDFSPRKLYNIYEMISDVYKYTVYKFRIFRHEVPIRGTLCHIYRKEWESALNSPRLI